MATKLEVKNLVISFRTQGGTVKAVRDVSFDLAEGETLAIVGESGSGKSVTSRAIMGILAGNGIVEGGEILYDGQDLLKITEEDFHKLRGDKIAMIFQDPMSSLNPIMKVGKQLTEAMILKGKASQRNARRSFNSVLKTLNDCIDAVTATGADADAVKARNKQKIKIFDAFNINGTKLESAYNTAYESAIEAIGKAEEMLFFVEKKKKGFDATRHMMDICAKARAALHESVVADADGSYQNLLARIKALAPKCKKNDTPAEAVSATAEILAVLQESVKKQKPNYFRLGYYLMKNPEADVSGYSVDELNELAYNFLMQDFMEEFLSDVKKGVAYSHQRSQEAKRAVIQELEQAITYFSGEITEAESKALCAKLSQAVKEAIDPLEVHKDSLQYTFPNALSAAVEKYFAGVKQNPKNQAEYDKQKAKRDALVAKGKTVTWKLVPPVLMDLALAKADIVSVLSRLKEKYTAEQEAESSYDLSAKAIEIIDYLKEQASAYVYRVTKAIAKARALKLLEEVGIPEPRIRYNQYPFEFSGGMRQRIVIAIALAANPDILICDEPTTALDVTIQAQILELINRLKKERNLTVIFITHDLGVVANMADRIAVMYAGKIVEYGTSDDVFYDPRHPYTWALLSSMPDLDTKEKLEAIPGTPPNMIYPPIGDAFAERNKYAMEIDFELQPPMFKVSDTHYAATWLLHPDAPKVEMPKTVSERIARRRAKEEKDV